MVPIVDGCRNQATPLKCLSIRYKKHWDLSMKFGVTMCHEIRLVNHRMMQSVYLLRLWWRMYCSFAWYSNCVYLFSYWTVFDYYLTTLRLIWTQRSYYFRYTSVICRHPISVVVITWLRKPYAIIISGGLYDSSQMIWIYKYKQGVIHFVKNESHTTWRNPVVTGIYAPLNNAL